MRLAPYLNRWATLKNRDIIKEIASIINSTSFNIWMSNNKILTNFLNGNQRKRELLIRDKIFCELENKSPGQYKKEKNYRDLIDLKTNSICELGHSGMFQNPHFVANKCLTDYYKRKIKQKDSRDYYSVQILTDIKKYTGSITYEDKVDILNGNRSKKYGDRGNRIKIINNDLLKISNVRLNLPMNFTTTGYDIDLYFVLLGPLNLKWTKMKTKFNPLEIDFSRIK